MDYENIDVSADIQDVAAPDDELSEDIQEVADPDESTEADAIEEIETQDNPPEESGRTEQDAAFAEMRRQNQELSRALEQQTRLTDELQQSLGYFFEGDSAEELSIAARAYAEQRAPDEVRADYERQREFDAIAEENHSLKAQLLDVQVDQLMQNALIEIQGIDPNIKSLDELGDKFASYIAAGLDTKEAYYATKAYENGEKVYAPPAIGKAQSTPEERDYYTSDELDHLSDEEMDDNWDKVMRSMALLGKRKQ